MFETNHIAGATILMSDARSLVFYPQKTQKASTLPAPSASSLARNSSPGTASARSQSAGSRPSGLLRPSASPYRKGREENAKTTSLLKTQTKADGATSRSLRQPSLGHPKREPASTTLDTKAGARGVSNDGGGSKKDNRTDVGASSGSGGGPSTGVWRWSGSQMR